MNYILKFPLSISCWLLAAEKELQEELRHEIDSIFQTDKSQNLNSASNISEAIENFNINHTDLSKLVKVNAFIMESLRIYPVGPISTRNSKFNGKLPGFVTNIICYISINNDPRYWKNPDKIDITRFISQEEQSSDSYWKG